MHAVCICVQWLATPHHCISLLGCGKYYRAGHYVCSRVYKVHTSLLNSDVVKLSSLHKLIATNWLQAKWSTRMCYTTGRYILYCSINRCNKTGSGHGSILKT